MNENLEKEEKEFFSAFIGRHTAPYQTQTPRQAALREWTFHHRPTNDKAVKRHLAGVETLGVPPRWYPVYGNIDIDRPQSEEKFIFDKMWELGIKADQFACFSTPRFRKNGNFRIYFQFELRGKPVTAALYDRILKSHFKNIEYNPRPNVSDRLVGGFGSELIDTYDRKLIKLDLRGKLDLLKSLKPIEVSELPFAQIPHSERIARFEQTDKIGKETFAAQVERLKLGGLEPGGCRRHDAQGMILFQFWRHGENKEQSVLFVKNWIRVKHNNLSRTAKLGDWQTIDAEIDRQAKSIFVVVGDKFPDSVHNKLTSVTGPDVVAAARFAPGDAVRQKQFFNLLGTIRPKFHWEWITIRAETWRDDIAGARTYTKFQRELESRGLMVSDKNYTIGSKTRKYKFNLELDQGVPLTGNGRNIDDYYEALKMVCNGRRREIQELTQINERSLRRRLNRPEI
jgi:hypothetical protein